MAVQIGKRVIADSEPCFITFEAGPTHHGVESAKRLVKLAAEAGADAVKFQILDPDRLVADRKMPFAYEVLVDKATGKTETVEEPLYDILCRRALGFEDWRSVKAECDRHGLAFFATVGFEDEVELLAGMGCHSIKIASADVNHFPLIRAAARTGMCLQLDTGNSTLGEIEAAIEVIRAEGNENIVIHQCPSGYPARLESINLNIIKTLKQMFPYPVAYSDHTPGWEMDIAALAIGANVLEKTITEDRMTRSVEHIFSLEPEDMASFVQRVREVETAFGSPRRILAPAEMTKRLRIRRSVHVKQAVTAGTRLRDVAVEFRRPGFGIPPNEYETMLDTVFTRDLVAGARIEVGDLKWEGEPA
jgi:N,N'-diacetyllegionaminate synthase